LETSDRATPRRETFFLWLLIFLGQQKESNPGAAAHGTPTKGRQVAGHNKEKQQSKPRYKE
jgi:hypothetical protein